MASKYQIGDLVWAKMKGYCAWPSRICDPSESLLKKPAGNYKAKALHCVYFFGSNNYAWLQEDSIKPFEGDHKAKNINGSKSSGFKEALAVIDDYIKNGGKPAATATSNNNNNSTNNNNNAGGDSNNVDGLPTIDEEIATILNSSKKPSNDSQTSSPSHTTPNTVSVSPISASVQRDYSRTPFKSRKSSKSIDDSAAEATTTSSALTSPTKRVKLSEPDNDSYAAPSTTTSSTFSPTKSPSSSSTNKSTTNKSGARNLLLKTPSYLDAPNLGSQLVNISSVSAKSKSITPSDLKFGFLGLGLMGQRLLKNLLNSGHKVTIWNRSPDKCKEFVEAGATKAHTPADVVIAADVTFSCLADPLATKEIVFGNCGILSEKSLECKGFVEMSSIDPETSNDISEAIIAKGGRYLEAPMISSGKKVAEEGNLTIVCAGDKTLYDDCQSCFESMGKHTFFLSARIGDAMKMNLVVSMLYGTLVGVLAESMALTDKTGLQQKDLLKILKLSLLNCPLIETKAEAIIENNFSTEMPLARLQKDIRLSLVLAETHEHPVPITAATNEVFKHAKHVGYPDHDAAAVYLRSRY